MQRKPSSLRATNRVYVKRIVGLLVIALLVFWVFIDPDSAAV
jgi:membrane-associated protease RseP (regulator of RpoE activity)